MSRFNMAVREGVIRFGYDFDRVKEVPALFGTTKSPYRSAFTIPGRENAIGWVIDEHKEELTDTWHNIGHRGSNVDGQGWNQIDLIEEWHDDSNVLVDHVNRELAHPKTRYVFWKEHFNGRVWPKFHGVFIIDEEMTRASISNGICRCFYKRIASEVECRRNT